jgi:IclR family transcriptional regulator, pca regulon regulatory protein
VTVNRLKGFASEPYIIRSERAGTMDRPTPLEPVERMAIKKSDNLETLVKGLALLRLFSTELRELSVQDAAECLGLSRAAARRFMMTLENLGYLERTGRVFRLTPEILQLGYSYFSSLDLASIVRPILKSLVQKLGEPCGLCVLHRDEIVYLGGLPGKQAFPTRIHTGTFLPAYPTAAGRVLLAGLSQEALEDYLRHLKITQFTPYTVSSVEALREIVAKTRKSGYSLVANELAYGTSGVAVPILDQENATCAALYMGLQHGGNTKAMLVKYLPHLQASAQEINSILRRSRGLPG